MNLEGSGGGRWQNEEPYWIRNAGKLDRPQHLALEAAQRSGPGEYFAGFFMKVRK